MLVSKHQTSLKQSGLSNLNGTLGKATKLQLRDIKEVYEKESQALKRELTEKNSEILQFNYELEKIMQEMEFLQNEVNAQKGLQQRRTYSRV